jgi:Methane oxygenase PmoA
MTRSLAILLALCVASPAAGQSPFRFKETSPTALELSDNGKPVFVYNFGMVLASGFPEEMRRSSYLHPVYAPDGTVLTDDFNPDHPHHRGISWMWPEVSVGGKKGDVWMVKEFRQRFVGWKARETDGPQARLATENGWFDGERKFVKEDVEIITHAAADNRRLLEFTLRFDAVDRPVEIVGTPDGKKGFGGFCFRFAPRDGGAEKTVIRTDQGISKKDGVLSRHPWAEISGTFKGQAAGARVDDMPSNPGYPNNGWLLRHGFGFLNVSYPGLQPITLEPGKPLVLKYRVRLFAGERP